MCVANPMTGSERHDRPRSEREIQSHWQSDGGMSDRRKRGDSERMCQEECVMTFSLHFLIYFAYRLSLMILSVSR